MNTFQGRDEQIRIPAEVARRALRHVTGMPVPDALHALRFTLSMACPEVARVVQIAAADAAHRGACTPENLVVVDGAVRDGADVVRLRRQAHGIAGWITTKTTDVTVEVAAMSRDLSTREGGVSPCPTSSSSVSARSTRPVPPGSRPFMADLPK